jgi:FAD/FMN-containing dehydrogenase/Fe-S oxidoreductase
MAEDFAGDLQDRVEGVVRAGLADRLLYSTDASVYKQVPRAVLIPRSVEDLHAAVAVCTEHRVPITPRGAGTSLEGQAIGPGLVIDCSRHLNRVLSVDQEAETATVEPGIVQDALRSALRPYGLVLGPDTATVDRATVGGMAGNNSSGARSIVYGKTVDALVSAKLLCADGSQLELGAVAAADVERLAAGDGRAAKVLAEALRVRRDLPEEIDARYPKVMRRVAGYNLDELVRPEGPHLARAVVGSEGTLGIVTELTLRLVRPPNAVGTALVHFDRLSEALEATVAIVEELGPSAVELVDALIVELAKESPTYRRYTGFVVGRPESLLLVEFFGESESEAEAKIDALESLLATRGLGRDLVRLDTPRKVQEAWALRKAGLPLLMSLPGAAKPIAFVEDCAVPVDRLPEYVAGTKEIFARHGASAGYYAHASVGCLHVRPVLDLRRAEDVKAMREISVEVCDLAMSLGGCISGEHGDGYAKSEHLERQFGPTLVDAFKRWKGAFDPDGLMNPGKIVDPLPLDSNLRLGASYRPPAIRTNLDFSREGGLAGAAELCNGNAACRKLAGTMCPSYMATRDERDTTRARANMLRSIMDGTLPSSELTGRAMYDVMDLCVGCKGCRSECPTGVDVAKLKTEFLSHYRAAHWVPLRSRLFSDPARMFKLARPVAPLANALGGSRLSSAVKRRLGIVPERELPRVARKGFRRTASPTAAGARGSVALFVDTFTEYLYPEIGHAAVKVLSALGYGVELPKTGCCGRPLLHEGLVDKARRRATTNYRTLSAVAERVEAIVVLEPSCASVLAEDIAWLVPEARSLRGHVKLFEEFVAERGSPDAFGSGEPLLLHGHCHAKALWGTEPTVAALGLPAGTDVEVVDSGCCGMAGSFGFEAEHLQVSMAMGERALFPAVRATDRTVIAAGTSCRQQIRFGAAKTALHPAEYLASKLNPMSAAGAPREVSN